MKADDFGNETYDGMVDIGDNAISTSDETDPKEKKQDDKKSSETKGRTYEGINIDELSFGEQVALAFVAGWNEFGKFVNGYRGEDTSVENNLNTTNETLQLAGLLIAGHLEMTSTNGGVSANKVLDKADEVATVTAKAGGQLGFKELQTLTKTYSGEMNAFFKSGGTQVASKEGLQAYKELATRILNGTGGAPASKLTETALKVQTQRIEMINKALQNFK